MGQNTKNQTRSLSNLLFHNTTRKSKHWQIYFKGMHGSVPQCLSWTARLLLRAEVKLILSALQMNSTGKLQWQVFMMMTTIMPTLLFLWKWCFIIAPLIFQNTTAETHLPSTWHCIYQPGTTLEKSSEKGLDQRPSDNPLLSGTTSPKLWQPRQKGCL